ncbi:FAD binding domain-containing protein [Seiridium cupressi]
MSLNRVLLGFAGLVFPVMTTAYSARPQVDLCHLTDARLPGRVAFANSTEYQDAQGSYYTAQEREVIPNCVFRPTSTADVAYFVRLAVANDPCRNCSLSRPLFAVRGGGHTLWQGAANANGSVTIDMRGMNSFSLSADHEIASIGGGSNFADIYPQLVPHNLTVLGGRIPGVAAGGFLSGGGKNFLSRRHGFGCDNIHGYEVVLANGDVIYASASENEDLWLALKGGSNNFGIITRYDLATYPLYLMWGGTTLLDYNPEVLEAEAQAFSDFMLPENLDDAADLTVLLGFVNGSFFIENTLYYSDAVPNPPVFANFTSLPGITARNLELATVAEQVNLAGSIVPLTIPRSFELVYAFHNADGATYAELIQTWQDGISSIDDIEGLQILFLTQPMPVTNGTNSLGLPVHDTDLAMTVLTAAWDNVADDDTVGNALQSIVDLHEDILKKAGLSIPFKYLNYADVTQNPISTYGEENIAHLWATSKKYDPNGLWQTRVPGCKLPQTS